MTSPSSSRPPSRSAHLSRTSSPALRSPAPRDDDADSSFGSPSIAGTGSNYGAALGAGSVYGGTVTPGGGGTGVGRVDLGNLNLVSWKFGVEAGSVVGVGEDEEDDGDVAVNRKRKRPFNAISTILSHPTRPPAPLRSSRHPLPPSSTTQAGPVVLPKPPPVGYYAPYLDSLGGKGGIWEEFLRVGRIREGEEEDGEKEEKVQEEVDLPDLGDIPELFFDKNFNLSNPLTWSAIVGSPTSLSSSSADTHNHHQTTDHALQTTLSTHLDHLESHLLHEISLRTPSFFSALSNLQNLTSQSTACLTQITALRQSLSSLSSEVAVKGLSIHQKTRELRRRKQVRGAVGELDGLRGAGRLGRELAEKGDWEGGLEWLEEVGRWWRRYGGVDTTPLSGEKEKGKEGDKKDKEVPKEVDRKLDAVVEESEDPPETPSDPPPTPKRTKEPLHAHLPLATLPCLTSIPEDLHTLSLQLAHHLGSSLSLVFSSFLERPLPASEDTSALQKEFAWAVTPLLVGLGRCDQRGGVVDVWRGAVAKGVKEGMRRYLVVDGEEDGGSPGEDGKTHSLADTLRDMSHEKFLAMSGQMYATMTERIGVVKVLGEELGRLMISPEFLAPSILIGILPPTPPSPAFSPSDLQDTLISACELANNRAAKVLVTRTPQHAELTLEEFVAVFEQAWGFVVGCEVVSGRMIVSLRGVISSQARAFLIKYHAVRLQASAKFVEEEQWAQVDVPVSTQHIANILISSAVADSAEHKLSTKSLRQGKAGDAVVTSAVPEKTGEEGVEEEIKMNGNGVGNGKEKEATPAKVLFVEDNSYHVVLATVKSVEMLGDYLKLMINLELVATDVMTRIVEYLKSFNSRTCQVVLGAGAMRSAGLKNITAKHLALASQSLSVIISLIPYIREFVRRHLSQKQAVMLVEFDKLKRDYQEHQNEIHAKLVAIMADRLAVHCASLRAIDWEAKPAKTGPNAYVELLVKETTTLHRVLSKYLSSQTVYYVMFQVVDAVNTRLSGEYGKVELKSEDAKKRMQQDVTFLVSRMKDLTDPSSPSPAAPLEQLIKDKPTPRRDITKTMAGLLRRQDSGQKVAVVEEKKVDGEGEKEEREREREEEEAMENFGEVGTPPVEGENGEGEVGLGEQVDKILEEEKAEKVEEEVEKVVEKEEVRETPLIETQLVENEILAAGQEEVKAEEPSVEVKPDHPVVEEATVDEATKVDEAGVPPTGEEEKGKDAVAIDI